MSRRADMASKAYRAALQLRTRARRAPNAPICPLDVAEEIGVEVRFVDIPSLEAMYVDDGGPKILLSADRPAGRQRFSCGHELGHHVFGHGSRVSCADFALADWRSLPAEEFLAQVFAGYLLLPKAAVSRAFAVRHWNPRDAVPEQFYTVAGELGASFDGLVTQAQLGLNLLGRQEAEALRAVKLPELRAQIAGQPIPGNLTIADLPGYNGTIDLRVGDYLLTRNDTCATNDALERMVSTDGRTLLRATRPGLSGLHCKDDSPITAVRIARVGYVGRAIFRHLEDPEDD